MTDQVDALEPGRTVERYEILSVLGVDETGPTYLCRDAETGFEKVVREFLPSCLAFRSIGGRGVPRPRMAQEFALARDRFVSAGKSLCGLRFAPFVSRIFRVLDANSTSYVVSENVIGVTLERRLADGPLNPLDVHRFLPGLLEDLHDVHEAGQIHGNIRPAAIMFVGAASRLIDFGNVVAWIPSSRLEPPRWKCSDYEPPEKAKGRPGEATSDVYSLAATLYRAIAGEAPQAAYRRLNGDPHLPLAVLAPPGFEPEFLAAIDQGMALAIDERPNSVSTWRDLLLPVDPRLSYSSQLSLERAPKANTFRQKSIAAIMNTWPDRLRGQKTWIRATALAITATAGLLVGVLYSSRYTNWSSTAVATAKAPDGWQSERVDQSDGGTSVPKPSAEPEEKGDKVSHDKEQQANLKRQTELRAATAQEEKRQMDLQVETDRLAAIAKDEKLHAESKLEVERRATNDHQQKQHLDPQPTGIPDAKASARDDIGVAEKEPKSAPGLLMRVRSGDTLEALF